MKALVLSIASLACLFALHMTLAIPTASAGGWEVSGAPQMPEPTIIPEGDWQLDCDMSVATITDKGAPKGKLVSASITAKDLKAGLFTIQSGSSKLVISFVNRYGTDMIRMSLIAGMKLSKETQIQSRAQTVAPFSNGRFEISATAERDGDRWARNQVRVTCVDAKLAEKSEKTEK